MASSRALQLSCMVSLLPLFRPFWVLTPTISTIDTNQPSRNTAQTYWNLLESRKGSELTLTKFDDEIHEHFKKEFPDYDVASNVDEDHMKSKEGKEKWRKFMQAYEKRIADYNFGTLLRNNPKHEYEEKTTIFGKRSINQSMQLKGLDNG